LDPFRIDLGPSTETSAPTTHCETREPTFFKKPNCSRPNLCIIFLIKSDTIKTEFADPIPTNNAQTSLMHTAAQSAILSQFSNKLSEDQFIAAQWLAKVVNHKETV
jgi:hypothetical protein